jgi:hypothetical protein
MSGSSTTKQPTTTTTDTTGRTMGASPIPSDAPAHPAAPEPKKYPDGFLSIYMLKTEQPHAADLAKHAAGAKPPEAKLPAVANVDDPTSGTPQNRSTGAANAFLAPADVVPAPQASSP